MSDEPIDYFKLARQAAFGNRGGASVSVAPVDPLVEMDREGWS